MTPGQGRYTDIPVDMILNIHIKLRLDMQAEQNYSNVVTNVLIFHVYILDVSRRVDKKVKSELVKVKKLILFYRPHSTDLLLHFVHRSTPHSPNPFTINYTFTSISRAK